MNRNIKTKLANWLIKLAFKLDRFHLEKCTANLEGPKFSIKSYVPQDDMWHYIVINLSYWIFVGNKNKKEKEEVYIDSVKLGSEPVGDPNIQTKIVKDILSDEPMEPLDNPDMEPWEKGDSE